MPDTLGHETPPTRQTSKQKWQPKVKPGLTPFTPYRTAISALCLLLGRRRALRLKWEAVSQWDRKMFYLIDGRSDSQIWLTVVYGDIQLANRCNAVTDILIHLQRCISTNGKRHIHRTTRATTQMQLPNKNASFMNTMISNLQPDETKPKTSYFPGNAKTNRRLTFTWCTPATYGELQRVKAASCFMPS